MGAALLEGPLHVGVVGELQRHAFEHLGGGGADGHVVGNATQQQGEAGVEGVGGQAAVGPLTGVVVIAHQFGGFAEGLQQRDVMGGVFEAVDDLFQSATQQREGAGVGALLLARRPAREPARVDF